MLVVADSSPLIVLIEIGHIDVLPKLFGQAIIPPEVWLELHQSNRPQAVRDFIASCPNWLSDPVHFTQFFFVTLRVFVPLW